MKICILTLKHFADRTWILRDKEILQNTSFDVDIIGFEHALPTYKNLLKLGNYLRKLKYCDIVVAWFAFPLPIFLSKMLGIPTIANAVGYEVACYPEISYGMPRNYLARSLISLALKSSDIIIAISKESLKWAYRWSRKPGFVIYEGINIEDYDCKIVGGRKRSKEPTIITIAFLGSMNVIRKDLPTLVKAISIVKNKYPNVKLYIIGEKLDGYPLLKILARKLNVEDNVIFTGKIKHRDLLKLLCNADIFVMTSYQEGFPTAACEAAITGIPLIVSDRPAMNEVFDENNAIIVKPADPIKLAKAIIYLLKNKDKANILGTRAMKLIQEKYNINVRKRKMFLLMLLILRQLYLKSKIKTFYKIRIKYVLYLWFFSIIKPLVSLPLKLLSKIIRI